MRAKNPDLLHLFVFIGLAPGILNEGRAVS